MRLLGYFMIGALLGVLIYAGLLAWPFTEELFFGPYGLDPERHWPEQVAAMAFAGTLTALAFRPAITRIASRRQLAFVALMFVLAGSAAAGPLLLLVPELKGLIGSGSTPSALGSLGLGGIALGVTLSALMGLFASALFLPIGFPIAMGGVFLLRRVARPATSGG